MLGKERHICLELFHLDWEMLPYDFSEQEYQFIGQDSCCVKGRRIFFFLNKAKSLKFRIFFLKEYLLLSCPCVFGMLLLVSSPTLFHEGRICCVC